MNRQHTDAGTSLIVGAALLLALVGAVASSAMTGSNPATDTPTTSVVTVTTPIRYVTLAPGQPLPSCGVIAVDPVTGDEADRGFC